MRIAGEAAGEFEVSGRDDKLTSRPILVPVANFRGRDVDIELTLTGGGESNRIRFGALTLVGEPNKNQWTTLRPQRVTSADGTVLVIQPDGSILASGPRPPQDRFTVEGQTNVSGITAIRLEALADPALEKLGPGRGPNGSFLLTDFRVTAAPVGNTDEPRPVPLANASSDFSPPNQPAANAIDNNAASGWGIAGATGQSHVAVFETRKEIENAAGTILTIQLHHGYGQSQMLGRFRVSVTTDPRPVRVVEGGVIHAAAPSARGGLKVVFDDERQFIESLTEGRPNTRVETKDKYSRGLCLRVKPGEAGGAKLAGVSLPIRAQPAAGEYRYMRFAWRKQGGVADRPGAGRRRQMGGEARRRRGVPKADLFRRPQG